MDTTLLPDVEDGSTHKTGHKSARRARLELITRSERRRRWSAEQKLEIVAESLGADTTPTEVARKHSISSGLLYTWRQQLLGGRVGPPLQLAPSFARVELADVPPTPDVAEQTTVEPTGSNAVPVLPRLGGLIEIVLPNGVTLRVDAQVDSRALRRVVGVLEGR